MKSAAQALRLAVDEMDGARLLAQALHGKCLSAVARSLKTAPDAQTLKDLFFIGAGVASRLDLGLDSENNGNAGNEKNEDAEATVELLKTCRAGV